MKDINIATDTHTHYAVTLTCEGLRIRRRLPSLINAKNDNNNNNN